MLSPGELEGEVDHSFFDSDGEDTSASKDGGEKLEKGGKAEKDGPPAHERLQPKPIENTKVSSHLKGEDKSMESRISLDKVLNDGSAPSKRRTSPTFSESSAGADSESSSRSSSRRSSPDSRTLPRPNKTPAVGKTRGGSAGSQGVPIGRTEGTGTNVSRLSSPDTSPLQSLDLNHTEGSLKEQRKEKRVPSSGLRDMHQEEDSDQDVDECELTCLLCSLTLLRLFLFVFPFFKLSNIYLPQGQKRTISRLAHNILENRKKCSSQFQRVQCVIFKYLVWHCKV